MDNVEACSRGDLRGWPNASSSTAFFLPDIADGNDAILFNEVSANRSCDNVLVCVRFSLSFSSHCVAIVIGFVVGVEGRFRPLQLLLLHPSPFVAFSSIIADNLLLLVGSAAVSVWVNGQKF